MESYPSNQANKKEELLIPILGNENFKFLMPFNIKAFLLTIRTRDPDG
jgi:hypothetical protein